MADEEDIVQKKEKKTLLEKYNIPLQHLSFEYVEKCNDVKELEKIVRILRSGEEGLYPKLNDSAEARLRQLNPSSRVLRVEEPVLTKQTAGSDQWSQLSSEMKEWENMMRAKEEIFKKEAAALKDQPPGADLPGIRSRTMVEKTAIKEIKAESPKPAVSVTPPKRSPVPRDYAAWDKYDADKELTLMEVEEQREQERKRVKERLQKQKESHKMSATTSPTTTVVPATLLPAEREVMATREKDKGNEFFKEGDYVNALKHYTASLDILPSPIVYNNRAMAEIKLHRYEAALSDCNEVLKVEPNNVKAIVRRGIAHQNRNNFQKAYDDFSLAVTLEPGNKYAKSLAEKMKSKCQPKRKGFRMKIEEESSSGLAGTVPKRRATKEACNPTPLPDKVLEAPWGGRLHPPLRDGYNTSWPYAPPIKVAVNEFGLPKKMCNCHGEPSYITSNPQIVCLMCHERRVLGLPPLPCGDCNHPGEPVPAPAVNGIGSGDDASVTLLPGAKHTQELPDSEAVKPEKAPTPLIVEAAPSVEPPEQMPEEQESPGPKKSPSEEQVPGSREQTRSTQRQTSEPVHRPRLMMFSEQQPVKLKVAPKYICSTAREERSPQADATITQSCGPIEKVTSPYEFTRLWGSTKPDPSLSGYAQILKAVSPEDLHTVVGNKLDGQMLSVMVQVLCTHFLDDARLLSQMMRSLVSLPRFSIASGFLDSSDKKVVEQLIDVLESSDAGAAHTIRNAFCL